MLLEIKTDNDPVLRIAAAPVEVFDEDLLQLVQNMNETMAANNGLGLAAPQVGVSKAVIIVDFAPHVLVNPEILIWSGKQVNNEGCLSFPGLTLPVSRHAGVHVKFQDCSGTSHQLQFSGLHATCIQHEIDHLHGVVFTQRVKIQTLLLAQKNRRR